MDVWWISTGFPLDFHWIHWMWWLSVVDGKLQMQWHRRRYLPASRVVSSHTRLLVKCTGGPQAPRYRLRVSVWRRKGTGPPSLLIRRPRAEARGFAGRMLSDSYLGSTTIPRCISGLCDRHVAACAFCTLQRCGRMSGGVLHTRTNGICQY